jgi:hypothetical protein
MGRCPSVSSEGMLGATQAICLPANGLSFDGMTRPVRKNLGDPVLNRHAPVYAVVNKGQ